jgi:hypothetical protein
MRYAWIGHVLLLAGCAVHLPPYTGRQVAPTYD